jgi:hypothetical protein
MSILKSWSKSASLTQLMLADAPTVDQTFLYRLSQAPGLC